MAHIFVYRQHISLSRIVILSYKMFNYMFLLCLLKILVRLTCWRKWENGAENRRPWLSPGPLPSENIQVVVFIVVAVVLESIKNGWVTCDFTSFSIVFQYYQDDGSTKMKRSCSMVPCSRLERLPSRAGLELGTA